jgi:hypothetical protein
MQTDSCRLIHSTEAYVADERISFTEGTDLVTVGKHLCDVVRRGPHPALPRTAGDSE